MVPHFYHHRKTASKSNRISGRQIKKKHEYIKIDSGYENCHNRVGHTLTADTILSITIVNKVQTNRS